MPRSAVLTDKQREQNIYLSKQRHSERIKEAIDSKDLAVRQAHLRVWLDTEQGGYGEIL